MARGHNAEAPDHSTISRMWRRLDVETRRPGFTWVQDRLVSAGLPRGFTVAVDAVEANAAIIWRDAGESYQDFQMRFAASGIKTPTQGAKDHGLASAKRKPESNKD